MVETKFLDFLSPKFGFIVLAGIAGCCYFLFLSYMVIKVFRNIGAKWESIPSMAKNRRKFYLVSVCVPGCTLVLFFLL
jgi:hypothetical protein